MNKYTQLYENILTISAPKNYHPIDKTLLTFIDDAEAVVIIIINALF